MRAYACTSFAVPGHHPLFIEGQCEVGAKDSASFGVCNKAVGTADKQYSVYAIEIGSTWTSFLSRVTLRFAL